jgi:solute carrier family 45 protein 1/2/4
MIIQHPQHQQDSTDTSIILHHADESSDVASDLSDNDGDVDSPYRPTSPRNPTHGVKGSSRDTADKAGVILGIHNVFLVLPQFIVTFLSSVIFYMMEPEKGLTGEHPQAGVVINGTLTDGLGDLGVRVLRREVESSGGSPDAVGLIFR